MPKLIVDNLCKEFPTRGEPLVVLRQVSLTIAGGENLAIVGPSGCGKSTLLHIIGTLDYPTAGSVTLDGEDPFKLNQYLLASYRNRHIGFVFQDHHLLPQLSVLENVLVPCVAEGKPNSDDIARAQELVDRVGLAARVDHRPAELSGGERQRVGIARAMIRRPKLILADEPTGNLDRKNANIVATMLLDIQREEGAMLVMVTHSADLAGSLQRQMSLDDGTLMA